MVEFSRSQIKNEIKPKLDYAIQREDFEMFKEILSLAGFVPGSEEFRSLEAHFWGAVAERRKAGSERQ
jgi:hypothetical protein